MKQSIIVDKTVQEVRSIPGKEMLADALTKPGRSAEALNMVLRNGEYKVPGGYKIRDSSQISVSTWKDLLAAETEEFN